MYGEKDDRLQVAWHWEVGRWQLLSLMAGAGVCGNRAWVLVYKSADTGGDSKSFFENLIR